MDMSTASESPAKWRMIGLISVAELLAMAVWFSASAILPALTAKWDLDSAGQAWLTMSVQIGFVVGALGSAILNLADRIATKRLFAISATLAGSATLAIPLLATSWGIAICLRFLTGLFLAGVYPVGMKMMATWTKRNRGLAIGMLVGALTLGSASPHLIKALGGVGGAWQMVMVMAGCSALLGAALVAWQVEEGPFRTPSPPFQWRQAFHIMQNRGVLLANVGYWGHMWELYAMWTWIALFFADSFQKSNVTNSAVWASASAFAVIGSGGLGSFVAGKLADQYGRTVVTSVALAISGTCAVLIGFLFGGSPLLLVLVGLVWGVTIVADSAQFSACISELCDPQLTGTALTLQTSLGFLLTLVTIRLTPTLENQFGWDWAFRFLALGPVVGILAMLTLRGSVDAVRLAGGRK